MPSQSLFGLRTLHPNPCILGFRELVKDVGLRLTSSRTTSCWCERVASVSSVSTYLDRADTRREGYPYSLEP